MREAGAVVTKWRVLRCPVCTRPTLDETREFMASPGPTHHATLQVVGPTVVFPLAQTTLPNLPAIVDQSYQAALRVRHEPVACAVCVGRTLEAVCHVEGAAGNKLIVQLNDLAKRGRIPQTLADMAQQLRQIRNIGAHSFEADEQVTEDDVPVILDFVEAILEYLYVAPEKIAAVERRLKRRTGRTSESQDA